ncbi:MAG: hypothetical protein JWO38_2838 [Gemmataceae bacterium]|nr:hypothetical protein [Gemmataceae bacterium]
MHPMQAELHDAQAELSFLLQLFLPAWAEKVRLAWPASDRSHESGWVSYVLAVVACRLATHSGEPAAADAAARQLVDAHDGLRGTAYAERAGDIWAVAMEAEEADDAAVLIVAAEEVAAAARRLGEREPMYRVVLLPLMSSVNDQLQSAREQLERAEHEAEGVLVQLQIAVLTSVRRVESPFLTLVEAAHYTRLEPGTISNAIYRGELKKQSRPRKVVISRDELDRFMDSDPPKKRRLRRGK